MKTIFTSLLVLCTTAIIAQTTFTPNWKKGDIYQLMIETEEKEWENDTLIEDEAYYSDPIVEVTDVSGETMRIKVTFTDVLLESFSELQETLDYEPEGLDLELIYEVNLADGSYELTNTESATEFMSTSIEEVREGMKAKTDDPEIRDEIDSLIDMLAMFMISDAMIEAYFNETLDSLLAIYYKPLKTGKPYEVEDSGENPFSPGDSLSATTIYTLTENKNNLAKIEVERVLDTDAYVEVVVPMIKAMVEGFGALDTTATPEEIKEAADKVGEELEAIDMEVTMISYYELNTKTTWPTSIRSEGIVNMSMGPMGNGRQTSITRIGFEKK